MKLVGCNPLKPPFHHTTNNGVKCPHSLPALGKAKLVVGGCASWAFSKGLWRTFLSSKEIQLREQHDQIFSAIRGLARALILRCSGCWNTARTYTP